MNDKELMMKIEDIFAKGVYSSVVMEKALTENDMRKGRGANANPYFGRVSVVIEYGSYMLGTDYISGVVSAAIRSGNTEITREDVKTKPVWHIRYDDWFNTDRATQSKFYLKIQTNKDHTSKSTTTYYLDGHKATEEEFNAFKGWLKGGSKEQSSTQTEVGVSKEHEQEFKLIALRNIVSIKQGTKEVRPKELLSVLMA